MRRLLPPVAACLLLLAGLLVGAQALVSPEMVQRRLVDEFTAWTGWAVDVRGETRISFFPVPSFSITDIRIGRGGTEALAEIAEFRGKFKVLPLLTGQISAREIVADGPRVHFAIDRDGRNNWQLGEGLARLAASPKGGPEVERAINAVRPGGLTVVGGEVRFSDARSGADAVATDVELEVYWRSLRDPTGITGAFTLGEERLEAIAAIDAPYAYLSGGMSPFRFAVGGPLLHLVFNGRASNLAGLQLDGDLTANTPSLRRAIAWAGYPIGGGATLGPASIKSQARWLGSTLAFNAASVEIDGAAATGSLNLVVGADRPALDGRLTFDSVDLTAYAEEATARFKDRDWQSAPAQMSLLSAVDLDLRLSARSLALGSTQLGAAGVTANLARGRLTLAVNDLGLYGGRLRGKVELHCGNSGFAADSELAFDHIPVLPVLAGLGGLESLGGFASGSLVTTTRAKDWGGVVRGTTGSGTLSLSSATLAGFDPQRMPTALLQVATGQRSDAVAQFSSVTADLTLAEGNLQATALTATGRGYVINMEGRASLLSPAIAAKGTLAVARAGEGQAPLDLPFLIGGSWQQPTFAPDLERLRRRTTGEAVPIAGLRPVLQ